LIRTKISRINFVSFPPEVNEQKRKSDNNDSAEDGIVFRDRLLEKDLQGFPGATAEISKLPIIAKVTTEDFLMVS
jgi:hypothetical protein